MKKYVLILAVLCSFSTSSVHAENQVLYTCGHRCKAPDSKVTLMAVGDIMMHKTQLDAGYNKETDSYNFGTFFKYIAPTLKEGDIVYGNLETPVAGRERKYTGYPNFNAPQELLTELKNNYFTHLSIANNHSLDRGAKGIRATVENIDALGFTRVGARSDRLESTYKITEKNGLRIGFLSYTYGVNGNRLPKDQDYMLSYIDKNNIKNDIAVVKKEQVDAVVVYFHFGVEYKTTQNKFQKEIAQLACDSGATIVLGAHPHVLEPITTLNRGNCLVAYSLGNFISGMSALYTDLGGILKVTITKLGDTITTQPEFIPTWVQRGRNSAGVRTFTVLPLDMTKIPNDITVTKAEQKRIRAYQTFVDTKIFRK